MLITGTILIITMLVGCESLTKELKAVEYATLTGDDWKVSIPAEQGLDMMFATEVGYNVANLETIYDLLVIKNSNLIAERYLNKGSVEQKARLQSATKSFTSASIANARRISDSRP